MTPLYQYKAKITEVYDGDTVTAVIDLGFRVNFEIKIRLTGIDAPEIRGAEKPQGDLAKDYLKSLVLDKQVVIKTDKDKTEKYGRYLGEIFIQDLSGVWYSVNQDMITKGFAVTYQ